MFHYDFFCYFFRSLLPDVVGGGSRATAFRKVLFAGVDIL